MKKRKVIDMEAINIAKAPAYTSPNPMTLICTRKSDGTTNLATLAFWTYASTNPGKIMFALNKGAYSLELLAKTKEVVLTVPGVDMVGALIGCGTSSGRDTNKVEKLGLAMKSVEGTDIQIPVSTRLAIHAAVVEAVDADDHVIHVCDVKNVCADDSVEAIFGWNGYAELAGAQKK